MRAKFLRDLSHLGEQIMNKYIFMATLPLFVLAACGDSGDAEPVPDADAGLAALAAGTGPYLVTYGDGSRMLAYSAADGTEYVATPPGPDHATWEVVDDQACVDPPGDTEEGTSNVLCLTMGEIGADGSWKVTLDGEPVTMRRLDMTASAPADQIAAGTYLVEVPEDGPALAVWTADGNAYLGLNAETGTWRADGAMRCSKLDSETEETCGEPISPADENGSFTAEDGENGTITVQML